jgi:hypothetical protein
VTDYCTTVDVMDLMPDTEWTGKYEPLLGSLITRTSRLIDRLLGREPGAFAAGAATARLFDGSGRRELWVDEMAAAPTLVEVDETGDLSYVTWAATDYTVWPYNDTPYTRLDVDQMNGDKAAWYAFPRGVRITARWGYSLEVPEDVKQAVLIQTVRGFKRAQQAFQDVGAIIELGQLRYVQALDPDVAAIVEHYRRIAI